MADAGPSLLRSVRGVACSRVWLVVIPAVLALDAMSISNGKFDRSTFKRFIAGPPPRSTAHGRPLMGHAVDTSDGLGWVWPWEPGYEAPRPERSAWEGVTVFVDVRRRTGEYHLTTESREIHVFPRSLSGGDRDRLHRVLLHELTTDPETRGSDYAAPIVEVLRTGGWSLSRPIPEGRRRNISAAVLVVVWLVLLAAHVGAGVVRVVRRRTVSYPLTEA